MKNKGMAVVTVVHSKIFFFKRSLGVPGT